MHAALCDLVTSALTVWGALSFARALARIAFRR